MLKYAQSIIELWQKPFGKPIVIAFGLFVGLMAVDTFVLAGNNIHYDSHPLREPIVFDVDETGTKYGVSIFIGNRKSKYRLQYTLSGPDGTLLLDEEDRFSRNKRSLTFVGEKTGPHKLWIDASYGSGPTRVMVSVYENDRSILPSRLKFWK